MGTAMLKGSQHIDDVVALILHAEQLADKLELAYAWMDSDDLSDPNHNGVNSAQKEVQQALEDYENWE